MGIGTARRLPVVVVDMKLFRGDRIRFSERIAADLPDPRGYGPEDLYRDFVRTFSTPSGRRVLAQILVWCNVWDRSHVTGDALETAKNEGARDIGLRVMETMNFEPAQLPEQTESEEPDG